MSKISLAALAAVFSIFVFVYFGLFTLAPGKINQGIHHNNSKEQDGILEARQHEFEITKDVKLGYVPSDRLIKASENLVEARRRLRANPSLRVTALNWMERGPYKDSAGMYGNDRGEFGSVTSGRIRAVHVDLADPTHKTVWVGGVSGGLWKTNDITVSPTIWTPVNDQLGNLAVADIVQDPTNHNIMYYGTGEKSYNYDAVRGGGIWKSTDHGVTWNLLPSTVDFWNISRMVVDGAGNIYAATLGSNEKGLQRSNNGGATWTDITPIGLTHHISEMKLSSTGRLHIVAGFFYNTHTGAAGYRYTDNPASVSPYSWTSPVTSFSPVNFNVEIATAGNTLYAAPSNSSYQTPVVFKSTDGGANWAATAANPPSNVSSGQAWYCIALGVDPANPDNVIIGGFNAYRSSNGGASWSQIGNWSGFSPGISYIHADQHFVTWKGNQVMIASDGGLFYSNNNGTTYTHRNINLRLKQFYSCALHPTATNTFLAGSQDNGTHMLADPGLSSSVEVTGGDGGYVHIDQDQPQYQFTSHTKNYYRKSTDHGVNWTHTYLSNVGQFINPTDYDDVSNKMYCSYYSGTYLRWEDPQTGNTATVVTIPGMQSGASAIEVSPHTRNRVFLGTSSSEVLVVDDADQAYPVARNITGVWNTSFNISCVAIGTDDNNLIITGSNYGSKALFFTKDLGTTWTNIFGNLPDIPVRWAMFFPGDNDKALIATEAGVFETADINGTATIWTNNPTFPIVRTNMLQYRPSDGTVIAATHGRGIFSAIMPGLSTYVQFQSGSITKSEAVGATTGCTGYTDYTIPMVINRAPSGTATLTLSVASSTGRQGVDFDITTNGNFTTPSNIVTFANGSVTPQPVTIRIYDDAEIEGPEDFTINYALSGATDAVCGYSNQVVKFSIKDNDHAPVPNAVKTASIGNGSFSNGFNQPFAGNYAVSKSQYIYTGPELRAAGFGAGQIRSIGFDVISKQSTQPYNGFTIALKNTQSYSYPFRNFEAGASVVFSGNYSTVTGENTIPLSTPFTWDGVSNLLVEICYSNTSPSPGNGDFVRTSVTSDVKGLWNYATSGTGCSLPSAHSGTGIYNTFVRPDITFSILINGNPVETALNASKTNMLGSNHDVYFYNTNGKVLARVENLSGYDFGCTQVMVDRAGTGSSPFWSTASATFLTNKTYRVMAANNSNPGLYRITLYYSAAEKAGWEASTGNLWSNIKLVKVKSQVTNYSPATPYPDGAGSVEIVTPVHAMLGSDYTLTGTFTSGFSGFAAGIPGLNPLPVTLVNFTGALQNGNRNVGLKWTTSMEQNARNFDIEKSGDGTNFATIGTVAAMGNSNRDQHYTFSDNQVLARNYYRLRMRDFDGRSKTSAVILVRYDAAQTMWVLNNPFSTYIDLRFAKKPKTLKVQLLASNGSLVAERIITQTSEQVRWTMDQNIKRGSYLIRVTADKETFAQKLVRE